MSQMIAARTAVVTGASSGIGAVYADRLAGRGHPLILVARDAERLLGVGDAAAEKWNVQVEILPADLTEPEQRDRVVDRIVSDMSVGMLVNNAGMSLNGSWLDVPAEELRRLIELNAIAPTLLARAAADAFSQRGGGAIITIGSVLSLTPELFDGAYAATKAYLLALSLSLGEKMAGRNVYAQLVMPGATRTEIFERSGKDIRSFPEQWIMDAGELVDAAMVGFDRRERVTIPPLDEESLWEGFCSAREALAPRLQSRRAARRYRNGAQQ